MLDEAMAAAAANWKRVPLPVQHLRAAHWLLSPPHLILTRSIADMAFQHELDASLDLLHRLTQHDPPLKPLGELNPKLLANCTVRLIIRLTTAAYAHT